MQTKHKVALVVLLVAAVVAALMVYLIKKRSASERYAERTESQSEAVPEEASGTAVPSVLPSKSSEESWQVYKNEKYGFEITFSEVWKRYEVNAAPVKSEGVEDEYVVTLPIRGDSEAEAGDTPLILYVYKMEVWDSLSKDSLRSTEIARNSDYVFAYSTWEAPAEGYETITEKEIADVMGTFKAK